MTPEEFHGIFRRLALALRLTEQDGAMVSAYYEALNDLSVGAIAESARALAKQPGRRFFPTSGEWREEAEIAFRSELVKALPPARPDPWRFDCESCDDTGWERFECTGNDFCGRPNVHAPHTFVRMCSCRESNRTYQRHHGPASRKTA